MEMFPLLHKTQEFLHPLGAKVFRGSSQGVLARLREIERGGVAVWCYRKTEEPTSGLPSSESSAPAPAVLLSCCSRTLPMLPAAVASQPTPLSRASGRRGLLPQSHAFLAVVALHCFDNEDIEGMDGAAPLEPWERATRWGFRKTEVKR
uniref:Uncharacterized protein n=1 Tax=Setaria viridis TaxID=4556 RepID=A0A4U6T7U2_SETVI|nr:hypothetical protein SEVIR_9G454700v2 [Setaria viridis]